MLFAFQYFLVFLFGVSIGSFLNVCIWRTWENINIVKGRSMCPNCHVPVAWYDNVPLLSFIFLRGKCRYCQKQISWQYPIIELMTGLLFLFVTFWHNTQIPFLNLEMVRDWLIISFLIFIFVYDLKHQEILSIPTLMLSVILFVISIPVGWNSWYNMLLGALVGGGFFLAQYIVSRGKWIGGGDVRLGLLMGIILGWPNVLFGLFFSYILGAVCGLCLVVKNKKNMQSEVPFGTYLTVGIFITMFWGEKIVNWYLGLINF